MKNIFRLILDKPKGNSEKITTKSVERNFQAEDSNQKEIVETLSKKIGLSEDELHNYIDEL